MIETKPIPPQDFNSEEKWSREDAVRHVGEDALVDFEFAMDRQRPFLKRVARFFRGESKIGRKVGALADIGMIFLPGGVQTGREAVQKIITKKENPMSVLKDKKWYRSKTMWSAVLIVITGLLQLVGVDLAANPEIAESIYQLLYTVGGGLGLYGLRAAIADKSENIPKEAN